MSGSCALWLFSFQHSFFFLISFFPFFFLRLVMIAALMRNNAEIISAKEGLPL